jgi:hypothetical protein
MIAAAILVWLGATGTIALGVVGIVGAAVINCAVAAAQDCSAENPGNFSVIEHEKDCTPGQVLDRAERSSKVSVRSAGERSATGSK